MVSDQSLSGNKGYKKYVVVGFWKDCKGVFTCFRMFKIRNPVFQMLQTSTEHVEREFFHYVSKNELMYFTNEYIVKGTDDNIIKCHFLDLNQATVGTKLTLDDE